MKIVNNTNDYLGFFCGLLVGVCLPLLLGGELSVGKDVKIKESFYGGVVAGLLLDIAIVVGLIWFFRK